MVKKDLKKTEHASERRIIAEDIVAIRNLKSFSQKKKDELIQGLLDKKELTQTPVEKACPFPQNEVYKNIRSNLSREQQDIMKENISIAKDGVVVINKLGKGKRVFLLFVSKPDHKNTFEGSYKDQYGKTGVEGVDYLTGKTAEQEVASQGKHFLTDIELDGTRKSQKDSKLIEERINAIINFFPGETVVDKRINFVKLLGLYEKKTGYWILSSKKWGNVGSVGYARLSRVDEDDDVYGVGWDDDNAEMNRYNQKYPSPFVTCEDCAA